MSHVVVATGFHREAACLKGKAGIAVVAGGGDPVRLRATLEKAAVQATGIISFGTAGALADGLAIGDWVVGDRLAGGLDIACDPSWTTALARRLPGARIGGVYADGRMIDTVAEKLALGERHRALVVDMESHIAGAVATERGLPFAIARCVSDEARHLLPHAITVSMRSDGGIDAAAMLRSLLTRPAQLPDMAGTVAGFVRAMRALRAGARSIGPLLTDDTIANPL